MSIQTLLDPMRALCTFALLLCTTVLAAQDPNTLIDDFFRTYSKGEPTKALDDLYAHMPWKERVADAVAKMKGQFLSLTDMVGSYHGHQEIARKDLAQTFLIVDHLVMFDRQPMRFRFSFYRPENTWGLFAFSYDDDLDDEMEDAVKAGYLR